MDWKRRSLLIVVGIFLDQLAVAVSVQNHWAVSARWLPFGIASWLVAAVFLGCAWALSTKLLQSSMGWVIMTTGALSNSVTILTRGHVVDYIPLGPWVTNIADLFVVLGLLVVLFSLLKPKTTP